MKKLIRTLLLVTIACMILSPIAMAQDALSAFLPSPYSSRVGTQLIYFYEDGNVGPRGAFKTFLTVTNTSLTSSIQVHFQFFRINQSACQELFDFTGNLTAGHRHVIEPSGVRRPSTSGSTSQPVLGTATDGRYILTITPVKDSAANDYRAIAFNWLTGQIFMSDTKSGYTRSTHAVPRMGVDAIGQPLADKELIAGPFDLTVPAPGNVLGGSLVDGLPNGTNTYLQMFRPKVVAVNSFFATVNMSGVPFPNRLTLFAFYDQYYTDTGDGFYSIKSGQVDLSGFVFDESERPFSLPPNTIVCLQEFILAADVASAGAAGNFPDYMGNGSLSKAVNATGGWLRLRVTNYDHALGSFLGWFSQQVGPYGGGDYLIGFGRTAVDPLLLESDWIGCGLCNWPLAIYVGNRVPLATTVALPSTGVKTVLETTTP